MNTKAKVHLLWRQAGERERARLRIEQGEHEANCREICKVVELTEQTSNQLFDILQDWETDLHDVSDLLEPLP
jgi:hypothetical protein